MRTATSSQKRSRSVPDQPAGAQAMISQMRSSEKVPARYAEWMRWAISRVVPLVSTVMTLFVVPAAYSSFDDLVNWNAERQKNGVGLFAGIMSPRSARVAAVTAGRE